MRTRNEQVQAHRFVTRRIVSALLSGEPETTDLPMRRLGLAIFASIMVATIAFAGVGIYGALRPGGGSLTGDAIVIERESGARFLYRDSVLYPVLNYASARLAMNSPTPEVKTVSAKTLRGLRRGLPVGIPDAPDSLPATGALVGLPWQLCEGPRSATNNALTTSLLVGTTVAAGAELTDEGLLVSVGGNGPTYVLLHGMRLLVASGTVSAALNLSAVQPVVVDDGFINALPAGPDLAVPVVPGNGGTSQRKVGGSSAQIGRLYRSGDVYYVLLADGLDTIGEVTANLLVAGGARPPAELTPAVAGDAWTHRDFDPAGMPRTLWKMRTVPVTGTTICARYTSQTDPTTQTVTIDTHDQIPEALARNDLGDVSAPRAGVDGVLGADRVVIAGGHGALVRDLPDRGSDANTTVYLITDQGRRYALQPATESGTAGAGTSGQGAQALLGYGSVTPIPIDKNLLALLPPGPLLDPAAALSFATPPAATAAATPTTSTPKPTATASG